MLATGPLTDGEAPATPDAALVLVVMAIYRPDPAHLAAQLDSISAQTHRRTRLIAVIADLSSQGLVAEATRAAGLCDAVILSPEQELDAVHAFEAGIAEAVRLAATESAPSLIALSDQDDIWHTDRLSTGIDALRNGADMVHSNARLVDEAGKVTHASMFAYERRQRRPGLRGLLYRNNITGMTLMIRVEVAEIALPFPAQSGVHFYHDLWLGLIAQGMGGIAFIDRPLVDYRQHGANAVGAVDRQKPQYGRWRRPNAEWLRQNAAAYGLARYLAHSARARLAEAEASGRIAAGRASTAKLGPYMRTLSGPIVHGWDSLRLAVTGHLALSRTAAAFAVVSAGRAVWALRQALGPGVAAAMRTFDARLYAMSPGVAPAIAADAGDGAPAAVEWSTLADGRKSPLWAPVFEAEHPAVTVLVPSLNPAEMFAGIATAIDIGVGLAERGHRVRFIATDLPVSSAPVSRNFILRRISRTAPEGTQARISIACGRRDGRIPAHRDDVFVATAWWSAHVARALIDTHGYRSARFLYLIQDFEPNFYPWGPEFAGAMESYAMEFDPIFNTTLLRDHFADLGFGFATESALAFHPAIDLARYTATPRGGASPRRLALYGRPEVSRNMHGTAIEALARFLEAERLGPGDIELISVGLRHAPVTLPGGIRLDSMGKLPWDRYPAFLGSVDVGLSLMYSPHPSHPPLEMAASGVRVVTNHFGPKDLSRLSPAILSVPATPQDLAEALSAAWHAPAVTAAERQVDLRQLGAPLSEALDLLTGRITLGPRG